MIKARILQKEKLTTKLLTNRPDLKAKFDNLSIQATDIENYKGAYIVTPSSESQMLVTKNKRMTDNVTVEAVPPIKLQKKAIVPSKEAQYVKPDEEYDGLAEVAVDAIPPAYIIPSGEKNITSNGKHDVRDYKAVDVDVPIPDGYIKPEGVLEITDNGEYDVTQKAGVNVKVPKGAVLPTLEKPAGDFEVFEDKEYIDADGNKQVGTFTITSEVTEQNGIIAQIKTALQGKAAGGTTPTQEKTVEIIENGTVEVTPDEGYALSKVTANVNVAGSDKSEETMASFLSNNMTMLHNSVVTTLKTRACQGSTKLTSVYLPNVTSLGSYAFYSCSGLTTVMLPSLVTVSTQVFYSCTSLTHADCGLLTNIPAQTFNACSALKELILRKTSSICTLSNVNGVNNTPIGKGTGYVYVPAALIESYKADTNWSTFAEQFRTIEDYPEICG